MAAGIASGVKIRIILPPTLSAGSSVRVLRGGSWNNNPHNARASYRNNNNPDNRNNNIGFRLVCARHIVLSIQAMGLLPMAGLPPSPASRLPTRLEAKASA